MAKNNKKNNTIPSGPDLSLGIDKNKVKSELNEEALRYVIDIARPSSNIQDKLNYFDENITIINSKGKKIDLKWRDGLDNSREISESFIEFSDKIITKHNKYVETEFLAKDIDVNPGYTIDTLYDSIERILNQLNRQSGGTKKTYKTQKSLRIQVN